MNPAMEGKALGREEKSDARLVLEGTVVGGVASGFVSRVLLHPIDTCKAKMQVKVLQRKGGGGKDSHGISVWRTFASVLQRHGPKELYRGLGMPCLGGVPASCLYFTSYELTRQQITSRSSQAKRQPFLVDFVAGFLAEAVSCVLWVPVDVCKERMQTQAELGVSDYRGSLQAFRSIARREGLRQLYKGYYATLLAFGPMSALYFMFYERFKQQLATVSRLRDRRLANSGSSRDSPSAGLRWWELIVAGAAAGGLASWITTPFDLVKLRLQVQRQSLRNGSALRCTPFYYPGFWQGLRHLYMTEGGIRGMYRGSLARVCFHSPSAAVGITIMETVRQLYLDSP